VGWGFQLQEPLVITLLLYLMLAIGLNLSGTFSLGGRWMGLGDAVAPRAGYGGAFASGVLAVIVASPCTAPFMGAAVGFAATRDTATSLSVFLALGLGFATPMLLLSLWPAMRRRLPRPGPWMERLRNALAFPMYGTAAWLLWVLSQQTDPFGLGMALAGAVTLAFGLWWWGQPLGHRRLQSLLVGGLVALAIAIPASGLHGREAAGGGVAAIDAEPWSPARVAALRAAGEPVLVNFTAAWCITCKVNEQVALNREAVRAAMAARGVVYLEADWTRRDAEIGAELRRHGRDGVPLYLLYPADGGPPATLPQLLTEGIVLAALQDL
jgi:thiol:disulfide interchange protein DsbD